MSVGHVVLGLLSRGDRHGYDLKHDHDACFPAARPLAFGQVYATLERLAKKGHVTQIDTVRVDGPDRRVFRLTEAGRAELAEWLDVVDDPGPHVANPFMIKAIVALIAADRDVMTRYLRRQRQAHLDRMRHYTRVKIDPTSALAEVLAADYALAHLDADIGWLETALERVGEIADVLPKETIPS